MLSRPASERSIEDAGVGEDERPGAVGALAVALVEAGLPEERGLLVAEDPGQRQLEPAEGAGVGRADLAPARHQVGQRVPGDAEQLAQLVGPVGSLEVEEQRARGVGDVGDVPGAPRHPGDEVGVDGADGVAARLDEPPRARLVLGDPAQLGAGEVRIQPQPGQLGDPVLVALVAQPGADVGGTPVLPDDRAARGAQRLAIPQEHRLALVGDADGTQLALVDLREHGPRGLQGRLPDLLRGVLDPARLREVLGELLVALGHDAAVVADDDGGDAGRPCVDGQDGADAHQASSPRMMARMRWSIHDPSGATRIS